MAGSPSRCGRGSSRRPRIELDGWRGCRAGAGELAGQDARPADARAAEEFYVRTFAEPALDINGFDAGSPYLQKTVLPVKADANVSIRLAPGPGSGHDRRGVRAARPRRRARRRRARGRAAGRRRRRVWWSPDSRAITLGLDAFERALGVRPLLIRSGGTLPIVPALAAHGIPAIITGFSLPDANIHSPNERMLVEYIDLGIVASKALLTEFAAL